VAIPTALERPTDDIYLVALIDPHVFDPQVFD
jgi:hypothetical protein